MAEWNNDQGIDEELSQDGFQQQDNGADQPAQERDYIDQLLADQGIDDRDQINFENEDGQIEERKWDDLTDEEKHNILAAPVQGGGPQLDNEEVQLLNSIRQSGMSPKEYLGAVQQQAAQEYAVNNQKPQFTVDQYSDDELFVADFMSRMGNNVTDAEAQEALERAKENQTLYAKQIGALRNEYRTIELENIQQEQIDRETQAQEIYNQYANKIVDCINDFKQFQGYDLNLNDEDKQMLYDFITGTDAQGQNYFAKALRDPATMVRVAWLALNGQEMVDDITRYYNNEITNVRRNSYERGRRGAANGDGQSVYRAKSGGKANDYSDDLDDF